MRKTVLMVIMLMCSSLVATAAVDLTDGEIVKVVLTLNEGEIAAGELAFQQSTDPDIRSFANMLVSEHKKNLKTTNNFATANGLELNVTETSKTLFEDAAKSTRELKASGTGLFDRNYLDQQVTMHQNALTLLDESLIPSVDSAELRNHLLNTRKSVETHLKRAKALRAQVI